MNRFFATLHCAVLGCCFVTLSLAAQPFQQRSAAEKQAYVKDKAERLGATISQRPIEFSSAYLALVTARVEAYAKRVGVQAQGVPGKEELSLVLARGETSFFQGENGCPRYRYPNNSHSTISHKM